MEWRIVVPVLCLIAFTGAGVNATSNNATNITASAFTGAGVNATSNNATNITASEPPSAPATATNQTANNNQTANTNQTVNTNQTTTTAATTVSTPAKLATVNVVFRILQEFKEIYSNLADPETIKLTENITNVFTPIYKKHFPNFLRMRIRKFSRGSIVADSVFEFDNANNTSPNVTEVTNTFNEAIKTGNFSFLVDATSINATDITTSATNQTANNNQTTTTAATTVSTPAKLATVNVVFRILQEFKEIYSNLTDPETIKLTENITNVFTPTYKKRFPNFLRMRIRKFSQGSIVADSVFEFDNTNNTSPNVTEVTNAFTEAITTGNFSFLVDATSINVTDITTSETNVTATANTSTTTQAATTSVSVEGFNLTFKMMQDFTDDLSNMSSSAAINLTNTVIGQLDKVFKKIASHRRTFVRKFRKGSIDVDAGLEFNKVSSPTAADLAKALADGVRNGEVKLPIDPKTIKVTDSTGATASKSPVLASMLTAFWMTLASLLLSAVMH